MRAGFLTIVCLLATLSLGFARTNEEQACHRRGEQTTFCETWYCRQNINRAKVGLPQLDLAECNTDKPAFLLANGKMEVKAQSNAMQEVAQMKIADSQLAYSQQKQLCGTAKENAELVAAKKIFNPCICNAAVSQEKCEREIRIESFSNPQSPYFQQAYYNKFATNYVAKMGQQLSNYGLSNTFALSTCQELFSGTPGSCTAQSPAARRRRHLAEIGKQAGMRAWRMQI